MKKSLAPILFCLFQMSALVAFEAGGLFSSTLNFDIATPNTIRKPSYVNNLNSISLWLTQNIDKEGYYNFSTQGSAYLKVKKLTSNKNSPAAIRTPLDIDMLRFSFFIPIDKRSHFLIDVGRRGLVDSTGIVLSQPLDGFFLQYKMPKLSLLASFAFTGLLNANTVVLYENKLSIKNNIYALQKNYASLIAMLRIPLLKASYSIDIDSLNFLETKAGGTKKLYLTMGIKGPIVRRLFFSTYISASFASEERNNNYGILTTGAIAYYFRKYNAKLGFNLQYATGGKNNFKSFTMRHISSQFFSPYSNVWNTGIKASMKPIKELYLQALCNVICKAQKEDNSIYTGFEWATQASYTIKRDISIEASLGQFIEKNRNIQTFIGLKGIISF